MAELIGIGGLIVAAGRLVLSWRRGRREEKLRRREERRCAYEQFITACNAAWVAIENYLPLTRVNWFTAPGRLRLLKRSGIWNELNETKGAILSARSQLQAVGSSDAVIAAEDVLDVLHRTAEATRESQRSARDQEKALSDFKTAREAFERVVKRDLTLGIRLRVRKAKFRVEVGIKSPNGITPGERSDKVA
jgi:hypothetical protein